MSDDSPKTTDPLASRPLLLATAAAAAAWGTLWFVWMLVRTVPEFALVAGFTALLPVAVYWARQAWRLHAARPRTASAIATICYAAGWHWCVLVLDAAGFGGLARTLIQVGTAGAFFIGLAWVVWIVERASAVRLRRAAERRIWNPLDPRAWYYGTRSRKLNQSLSVLLSYTVLFSLAAMMLGQMRGCQEIAESPAGGGQMKQLPQTVRIQKIIRKKFVVNPYSGIKFDVPPIDEVKLQLQEVTEHAYSVGYGEGTGAGFAGGTSKGKVRLIRLEYSGGDWDLNFGVGADLNMLLEYGTRTQQKVAEETESRTILDLRNFPDTKAPPVVFLTGQKSISVTAAEIKTLQQYLNDKHGMLFISNGGSGHFHQQVLALMNQAAPDVRPVPIPLDDPIHTVPYRLAAVPIVAPHGGREALGWYKDGRWICYYHPGDISDAWCDDHAGVGADVWEACYQLGVNVLFYGYAEHAKWTQAKGK
ncbi:MAG: DUF4159 domain-containing protein [Pirellulales bacterium]